MTFGGVFGDGTPLYVDRVLVELGFKLTLSIILSMPWWPSWYGGRYCWCSSKYDRPRMDPSKMGRKGRVTGIGSAIADMRDSKEYRVVRFVFALFKVTRLVLGISNSTRCCRRVRKSRNVERWERPTDTRYDITKARKDDRDELLVGQSVTSPVG